MGQVVTFSGGSPRQSEAAFLLKRNEEKRETAASAERTEGNHPLINRVLA